MKLLRRRALFNQFACGVACLVSVSSGMAAPRKVISVKDFNATGDGLTDDADSIRRAVDSLSLGDVLFFPEGKYLIRGSIRLIKSNITLMGSGAEIIQGDEKSATFIATKVSFLRVQGIRFRGFGLRFGFESKRFNGISAFVFFNSSDIDIRDCVFEGHYGGSVRWTGSSKRFSLVRNRFFGLGERVIVSGENGGDFAIGSFNADSDDDILIKDNLITGHSFGVYLARGAGALITGNSFFDIPGQHAIYLSSQSRVVVSSNNFENIALVAIKSQIAMSESVVWDIDISGNKISRCGLAAITISSISSIDSSGFYDVKIKNNVISNCYVYSIFLNYAYNAVISGNVISDSRKYGIFVGNFIGSVSRNRLINFDGYGVFLRQFFSGSVQDNDFIISNKILNELSCVDLNKRIISVSSAKLGGRNFFGGNKILNVETDLKSNCDFSGVK